MKEKIELAASFQPSTVDDQQRIVDVCYYTGVPVSRTNASGQEYTLRFDPSGIDLSILNSGGAAVCDSHFPASASNQLGVVRKAWSVGPKQYATLQFSPQPYATDIWANIKAGIVQKLSAAIFIDAKQDTTPAGAATREITATKWQPFEISVLSLAADLQTQFLAAETETQSNRASARRSNNMSEVKTSGQSAVTLEQQQRESAIRLSASKFHIDSQDVENLVAEGLSLQESNGKILELAANKFEDQKINGHVGEVTRDHSDGVVQAMSDALILRANPRAQVSDRAREYTTLSLVDMGRECLRLRGARIPANRETVMLAAMTTSDFPDLLLSTGNRTLRMAYEAAPAGVLKIAHLTTSRDFRPINRLQLSEAPTLLKVNENGEFHQGAMAEAKATYALATFGRIVSLSRRALINDDLSAFTSLAGRMGVAAKEFEAGQMVTLLTSNPTMNDSIPVFDARHGNVNATNALGMVGLGKARMAMRLMKGLSAAPINATPRWLVVPAALETVAEQCLTHLLSQKVDDVNPFADAGLSLIVDPRLDANSASTWYLATDVGQLEHLEYAYLEGVGGVQTVGRWGFETDSYEMKISLDFGCGVVDFRGLSKNTQ